MKIIPEQYKNDLDKIYERNKNSDEKMLMEFKKYFMSVEPKELNSDWAWVATQCYQVYKNKSDR